MDTVLPLMLAGIFITVSVLSGVWIGRRSVWNDAYTFVKRTRLEDDEATIQLRAIRRNDKHV